jgi:hypothetical protein
MTFWDFLVWSFWFYLVFVCITIFIRSSTCSATLS